jgi:hypothetical protein
MKRRVLAVGCAVLFGLAVQFVVARADDKPPEKPDGLSDINRIMKRAHLTPQNRATRNNLDNKVLDGKATDAEKKELRDLYAALAKAKPPAGKLDDWKKRTDELLGALEAVYDGKENAKDRFIKARDCKGCHAAHRNPS